MRVLTTLLRFVQLSSMKYGIDESHSLGHSMDVLYHAHSNYKKEVLNNSILKSQETIICSAAILHDLYDHKYPAPDILNVQTLLKNKMKPADIDAVHQIIHTMSYSKIKKDGFPNLGKYQLAYHIVREADLLASFNFDRAMLYHFYHSTDDVVKSYENSKDFFENRVLKYEQNNLFMTNYGKAQAQILRIKSISQIQSWYHIIQAYERYI